MKKILPILNRFDLFFDMLLMLLDNVSNSIGLGFTTFSFYTTYTLSSFTISLIPLLVSPQNTLKDPDENFLSDSNTQSLIR